MLRMWGKGGTVARDSLGEQQITILSTKLILSAIQILAAASYHNGCDPLTLRELRVLTTSTQRLVIQCYLSNVSHLQIDGVRITECVEHKVFSFRPKPATRSAIGLTGNSLRTKQIRAFCLVLTHDLTCLLISHGTLSINLCQSGDTSVFLCLAYLYDQASRENLV